VISLVNDEDMRHGVIVSHCVNNDISNNHAVVCQNPSYLVHERVFKIGNTSRIMMLGYISIPCTILNSISQGHIHLELFTYPVLTPYK